MGNRSLSRYFAAMNDPKVRAAWLGALRPDGWCLECGCGKNAPDGTMLYAHLTSCSRGWAPSQGSTADGGVES